MSPDGNPPDLTPDILVEMRDDALLLLVEGKKALPVGYCKLYGKSKPYVYIKTDDPKDPWKHYGTPGTEKGDGALKKSAEWDQASEKAAKVSDLVGSKVESPEDVEGLSADQQSSLADVLGPDWKTSVVDSLKGLKALETDLGAEHDTWRSGQGAKKKGGKGKTADEKPAAAPAPAATAPAEVPPEPAPAPEEPAAVEPPVEPAQEPEAPAQEPPAEPAASPETLVPPEELAATVQGAHSIASMGPGAVDPTDADAVEQRFLVAHAQNPHHPVVKQYQKVYGPDWHAPLAKAVAAYAKSLSPASQEPAKEPPAAEPEPPSEFLPPTDGDGGASDHAPETPDGEPSAADQADAADWHANNLGDPTDDDLDAMANAHGGGFDTGEPDDPAWDIDNGTGGDDGFTQPDEPLPHEPEPSTDPDTGLPVEPPVDSGPEEPEPSKEPQADPSAPTPPTEPPQPEKPALDSPLATPKTAWATDHYNGIASLAKSLSAKFKSADAALAAVQSDEFGAKYPHGGVDALNAARVALGKSPYLKLPGKVLSPVELQALHDMMKADPAGFRQKIESGGVQLSSHQLHAANAMLAVHGFAPAGAGTDKAAEPPATTPAPGVDPAELVSKIADPKAAVQAFVKGTHDDAAMAALGPDALYHLTGAMLAKGQKPDVETANAMGLGPTSFELLGTLLQANVKGTLLGGKNFADAVADPNSSLSKMLAVHFSTPEKLAAVANPFLKAHKLPMLGVPGSSAPSAQPMAGDPKVSPGADALQHPAVIAAFSAATNPSDLHKALKGVSPEGAEAGWQHKAVAQWLVQKGVSPEQGEMLAHLGDTEGYPDATPTTGEDLMTVLSTLPSKTKAALKKKYGEDWHSKYIDAWKAAEHFTHPEATLPFGIAPKMLPKHLITVGGNPVGWYDTLKQMESGKPAVGSPVVKYTMAGGDPKELVAQWKDQLGPKWKEKLVQAAAKLHGYGQSALPDEVQAELPADLAQVHDALMDSSVQAVLGDYTGSDSEVNGASLKSLHAMLTAAEEGGSKTMKGLVQTLHDKLGANWKAKTLEGVAQFHGLTVDPDDLDPPKPVLQPDSLSASLVKALADAGAVTIDDLEGTPFAAELQAKYGDLWKAHAWVAYAQHHDYDVSPSIALKLVGPPLTNPAVQGLLTQLNDVATDAHSAATAAENAGKASPDVAAYMTSLLGSEWPSKLGVMCALKHTLPVNWQTLVKASTPFDPGSVPTWTHPDDAAKATPAVGGVGSAPSIDAVKGAIPEGDYDDFQALLASPSGAGGWDTAFLASTLAGKGTPGSTAVEYHAKFKQALEPLYGADWPHHLAAALHMDLGVPLPPASALKVLPPVEDADLHHPDVQAMLQKATTYTARVGLLYYLDPGLKDQLEAKYGAGWREKMALHLTAQAGETIPDTWVLSHVLDLEKTKPGSVTFSGASAPAPASVAKAPVSGGKELPTFDSGDILFKHLPGDFPAAFSDLTASDQQVAAHGLANGTGPLASYTDSLKKSMEPVYGSDWPLYAVAAGALEQSIPVVSPVATKLMPTIDSKDLTNPAFKSILSAEADWPGGMTSHGGLVKGLSKAPPEVVQQMQAKYGPKWANLLAAHVLSDNYGNVPASLFAAVMKDKGTVPSASSGAPSPAPAAKLKFSVDDVEAALGKDALDALTTDMASHPTFDALAGFYQDILDGKSPLAPKLKAALEPAYGPDWAAHAVASAAILNGQGIPSKAVQALLPPLEPEDVQKVETVPMTVPDLTNGSLTALLDGLPADMQAEYAAKYGPGWKPYMTMQIQAKHKPAASCGMFATWNEAQPDTAGGAAAGGDSPAKAMVTAHKEALKKLLPAGQTPEQWAAHFEGLKAAYAAGLTNPTWKALIDQINGPHYKGDALKFAKEAHALQAEMDLTPKATHTAHAPVPVGAEYLYDGMGIGLHGLDYSIGGVGHTPPDVLEKKLSDYETMAATYVYKQKSLDALKAKLGPDWKNVVLKANADKMTTHYDGSKYSYSTMGYMTTKQSKTLQDIVNAKAEKGATECPFYSDALYGALLAAGKKTALTKVKYAGATLSPAQQLQVLKVAMKLKGEYAKGVDPTTAINKTVAEGGFLDFKSAQTLGPAWPHALNAMLSVMSVPTIQHLPPDWMPVEEVTKHYKGYTPPKQVMVPKLGSPGVTPSSLAASVASAPPLAASVPPPVAVTEPEAPTGPVMVSSAPAVVSKGVPAAVKPQPKDPHPEHYAAGGAVQKQMPQVGAIPKLTPPKALKVKPSPTGLEAAPPHVQGMSGQLAGAGKAVVVDAEGKPWLQHTPVTDTGTPAGAHVASGVSLFHSVAAYVKPGVAYPQAGADHVVHTPADGAFQSLEGVPPSALSESEQEDVASEHVLDWLMGQHGSHAGTLVRRADGRISGISKGGAFQALGSDRLDTSYWPGAADGAPEPYANKFWDDWAAGKHDFDPQKLKPYLDSIDSIDPQGYAASLREHFKLQHPGQEEAINDRVQDALIRKATMRGEYERFLTDLYRKRTGEVKGVFDFDSGWQPKPEEPYEVPVSLKDHLTDMGVSVEAYKDFSVNPPKPDAKKVTLKVPKSTGTAKLLESLKKAGVTVHGTPVEGSYNSMVFIDKASLENANSGLTKTVIPAKSKLNTPSKPKYYPKITRHKAMTKASIDDLKAVDASTISYTGKAFHLDGGAMEGQVAKAKKMKDKLGSYHLFQFKLRAPVWKKLPSGAASTFGFNVGAYDPATGAFETTTSTSDTVKTQLWKTGTHEVHLANDSAKYAYMGSMYVKARPKKGQSAHDAMVEALNGVRPGLADELLRDPTPEEKEVARLSRLLWAKSPQAADQLSQQEMSNPKARTVEKLHQLLDAAGVTKEDRAAVQEREILPGHMSHVLPGRSRKMKARFLFQGIGSTDSVSAAVNIMKVGLLGIHERNLAGMPKFGGSYDADVGTGSGDGTLCRVVTDKGLASGYNLSSHMFSGGVQALVAPDELDRLDTYAYNSDRFGRCRDDDSGFNNRKSVESIISANNSTYHSDNEISFRKGIDPSRILRMVCQSESVRQKLIAESKDAGVHEVNGVPIQDFVVVGDNMKDVYEKYVKPLGY